MTPDTTPTAGATVGIILAGMVAVAIIESVAPLHARNNWNRAHLGPNLALTFITFATNLVFNAALVAMLISLEARGAGLVHWLVLSAPATMVLVVLGLDFAFYLAHVAMHTSPALWLYHRVHHSDPAVDVTTTIRQHPGEGVIRYVFMALFAGVLGATPSAFALYRGCSALNGLLEHANVRMPRGLDRLLSLVVVTPNMHKVHHSRFANETNTNYGNICSLFDRLFGTFTPTERGLVITYGLTGLDDPTTQSTAGLLALPFRHTEPRQARMIRPRPDH